jgi:heme exporter protein A
MSSSEMSPEPTRLTASASLPNPSPNSAANLFEGLGLSCRRGDRLVFRDLDFALPAGGALVLTGPNGSGKSSLLRVMAGLTPPLVGRLTWDGAALSEDRAAHRVRLHFIGHLDALKPVLTAAEALGFWAALRGAAVDRVMPALQKFHLAEFADWPCRFLSSGQRRRLALARLVASPAPLWLLDEPTSGLDDASTADLLAAIAEHRAGGGRIAVATHLPLPLVDTQSLSLGEFTPRRSVA